MHFYAISSNFVYFPYWDYKKYHQLSKHFFFLDFLGGVILHWNLIASKNQFTNKKSQRKVATLRKNDAFCSCLGTNYYTLRPQLGHVHTFDRNAYVFVPCASFRYNFGELFFKIVTKEKPSLMFCSFHIFVFWF